MIQKKIFTAGMNSDTATELLPQGSDRSRFNLRVLSAKEGGVGKITTVDGNTLVSYDFPGGDNTVIGSKEDPLQQKVYYFVYNSSNNHLILEYDSVANSIATVFRDGIGGNQANILNFDIDHLITGINVIELDADNHLLYWTDNLNEPRKINIEKGKLYISSSGTDPAGYINSTGAVTGFDPLIINRIKQPPLECPEYEWVDSVPDEDQFTADQTALQAFAADTLYYIVEYDHTSFNNGSFSTVTHKWTVPKTDIYYINTSTSFEGLLSPSLVYVSNWAYRIKNGSTVLSSGSLVNSSTQFTTVQLDITAVLLNAGDIISFEVANSLEIFGVPIPLNAQGLLFEANSVGIANLGLVNYLFKKLFQFKIQFVYDDYEVSSWSPISKYEFPVTKNASSSITSDDIIYQNNAINITVPTGSSIVTKIRIAGKEGNDLDFSLIAELDKSDLHLSDNSTTVFRFINDGSYIPLEINESIKLFDNVPQKSQSQELISGNRLVDGLITEGYDPVNIDLGLTLSYGAVEESINNHYPAKSYLKSGSTYNFGIVYYDEAGNRSGVTNIVEGLSTEYQLNGAFGTKLAIPFLTDTRYASGPGIDQMRTIPIVTTDIYNEPPSWATHYQILRSKNQSIRKYIQFAAKNLHYHPSENTITLDISNIYVEYKSKYPLSTLSYDFTKGDRIRFIAPRASSDSIGGLFPFNDVEILSFVPATGIITISDSVGVPTGMNDGVFFEIYTPSGAFISDDELMYEVCEHGTVSYDSARGHYVHSGDESDALNVQITTNFTSATFSEPTFTAVLPIGHGLLPTNKVKIIAPSSGSFSGYSIYGVVSSVLSTSAVITTSSPLIGVFEATLGGTISKSAIAELTSGDCFRRVQDMCGITISDTLEVFVEASNVSNMFKSEAWDYGRPNRIDPDFRQVTRPSTIYWSESFIPETNINGLSTVYDSSFQTYEAKYGGIQKLYAENFNLNVFQELKIGQLLVNQAIVSSTQGANVVGQSTDILPEFMKYYQGEFGIGRNPESFSVYGFGKYGIDVNRGVVWRLYNDGVIPISSNYFMQNYFQGKCKTILASGVQSKIYGVFDVQYMEYIISLGGETLAFNEKDNLWSTFYGYVPENMCKNGIGIVSFKEGELWRHDSNALQNNFYGQQQTSDIVMALNDAPSDVKIFTAVEEDSKDVWELPVISNNEGQLSNLIAQDFRLIEGQQYAAVLKDILTPNITAGTELFQGDPMRSRFFLITLRRTGTAKSELFCVNLKYIISQLHNR